MDWSTVKAVISKAAPILGSALGPIGGVAGAIVAAALGTDNDPEKVMEALQKDPEALVKLKTAEMENKVQLASLALEQEKNQLAARTAELQTAAADRDSARKFAATGDNTARYLAYIFTFGLFGVLGAHFAILWNKVEMEPLALQLISTLEGVLISMVLGAKEFFFGSSAGDQKKSDDLSQIAKS